MILTHHDTAAKYQTLSLGQIPIESSMHLVLAEHLNSEVVLGKQAFFTGKRRRVSTLRAAPRCILPIKSLASCCGHAPTERRKWRASCLLFNTAPSSSSSFNLPTMWQVQSRTSLPPCAGSRRRFSTCVHSKTHSTTVYPAVLTWTKPCRISP